MRVRSVRELGAAVRERREALGLSQQAIAERAGVTREWVVRFEGGKASVRLDRVFDVLTVLDLSVELNPRHGDAAKQGGEH
ncbi:helix-turn-helix transcriptional regulator [Agromyces sp. ISL-38]|uniref:helix-turn-helix domain-containing protein n=1 Tax=Agromyces sp. ISL-38 TaxID=2819107 RepID=UPI001BEA21C0|nr:helix-turn-helix domain-containing protein [Agromyces sp. ISL-38]MBT2500097.1 helix-turn-helix transcriptional regulator [Agromyces sp. ISL-38]